MSVWDMEGDVAELKIPKEYYCYKCKRKMVKIGQMQFKCQRCGADYNEDM